LLSFVNQRSVIILKRRARRAAGRDRHPAWHFGRCVKAHLARGRAGFADQRTGQSASRCAHRVGCVVRYISLFNQRDWDGLRALLADDVRTFQSIASAAFGRRDVGTFFTI